MIYSQWVRSPACWLNLDDEVKLQLNQVKAPDHLSYYKLLVIPKTQNICLHFIIFLHSFLLGFLIDFSLMNLTICKIIPRVPLGLKENKSEGSWGTDSHLNSHHFFKPSLSFETEFWNVDLAVIITAAFTYHYIVYGSYFPEIIKM